MKLTKAEADAVESMIDRYTLSEVVRALSQIASEKEEHVQSTWNDTELAQQWARAARLLDYASGDIYV